MGSLPHIVEDCMGVLQLFSDGTVHRRHQIDFPFPPAIDDASVAFHDVDFDPKLGLSLRIYRPKSAGAAEDDGGVRRGLPVVFYFHGGGFCVGSRLWPNCHNCCLRLASGLGAVVVSPDYRLAPEHRLPAAVDDAVTAVEWLATADGDLAGGAVDLDRVFVLGDSSGGNMAHHLAVQLGSGLGPRRFGSIRVRGFILLAPFFGGVDRTCSEEGPSEAMLNLEILDRFWRLSIPEGETRDHPFANPFGPNSPSLEKVSLEPILAIVGGKEMLKDRVKDYVNRLKDLGKNIEYVEFEGQEHGFFTNYPYSEISHQVLEAIKSFMVQNSFSEE